MQLQSLNISLDSYGVNEGRYTGNASFKNKYGTISLNLDPDTSDVILHIVAERLVSSARTVGQELTAACVSSTPSLLASQAE